MSKGVNKDLEASRVLFTKDEDPVLTSANVYSNWPLGRGVFLSYSKRISIWLNQKDHVKLMVRQQDGGYGRCVYTMSVWSALPL